jgi:hypothetical protein
MLLSLSPRSFLDVFPQSKMPRSCDLGYVVFLGAYIPIFFDRKIYNAIQFCMVVKAILV